MKYGNGSQAQPQPLYCGHCSIRIGVGENYVARGGKVYHRHCDAKVDKARRPKEQ